MRKSTIESIFPTQIEAIKFRLEQQGKDLRSLVGVIGQRTRVYEVMRGDRPLSLNMIRSLHDKFGISADVLIQPIRRKGKPGKNCNSPNTDRFRRSGIRKSA